jgi:hypothetical protein
MLVIKADYLKVSFTEFFTPDGKNIISDSKIIGDLICYTDLETVDYGMEACAVVIGIEDSEIYYVPVLWLFQLG